MRIPNILIGTFGNDVHLEDLLTKSLSYGIRGFDTAPSYGNDIMAINFILKSANRFSIPRNQIFIETKIDLWQMAKFSGDVSSFVKNNLRKTKMDYFDAVLIHWPIQFYLLDTWESLNTLKKEGYIKEIGICNLRRRHLNKLKQEGIIPPILQIERHPLLTCVEELNFCRSNGVEVLSYSPLCQMNEKITKDSGICAISQKYNKTTAQIILKWQVQTGAHPIFKSSSPDRVKSNINIFDFSLSDNELNYISSFDCNYKIFLESWGCPGF